MANTVKENLCYQHEKNYVIVCLFTTCVSFFFSVSKNNNNFLTCRCILCTFVFFVCSLCLFLRRLFSHMYYDATNYYINPFRCQDIAKQFPFFFLYVFTWKYCIHSASSSITLEIFYFCRMASSDLLILWGWYSKQNSNSKRGRGDIWIEEVASFLCFALSSYWILRDFSFPHSNINTCIFWELKTP